MKYLLLLGMCLFLGGCATQDADQVSTKPWNRPEPHEGGPLSFLNTR